MNNTKRIYQYDQTKVMISIGLAALIFFTLIHRSIGLRVNDFTFFFIGMLFFLRFLRESISVEDSDLVIQKWSGKAIIPMNSIKRIEDSGNSLYLYWDKGNIEDGGKIKPNAESFVREHIKKYRPELFS